MTIGLSTDQSAQRIDRWLWCARFFKTRSLGAKFVAGNNIRVTRAQTSMAAAKPSFLVRPKDVLVFTHNDLLRIIAIINLAQRRGPAPEAQLLYDDQSPPPPPKTEHAIDPFGREKGAGRPTKRERRALDALKNS